MCKKVHNSCTSHSLNQTTAYRKELMITAAKFSVRKTLFFLCVSGNTILSESLNQNN